MMVAGVLVSPIWNLMMPPGEMLLMASRRDPIPASAVVVTTLGRATSVEVENSEVPRIGKLSVAVATIDEPFSTD